MSWTRGALTAVAACVLLLTGCTDRGSGGAEEPGARASPTPAGRLLGAADEDGRRYREADAAHAPEVGIVVQPTADDGWDVRLTVGNFRFSPAGSTTRAVGGRGVAYLFVDGDLVTRLRGPEYRLVPGLVPRGTHHVTARLYADDDTVWTVDGRPVENTADITASHPDPADDDPGAETGVVERGAGAGG